MKQRKVKYSKKGHKLPGLDIETDKIFKKKQVIRAKIYEVDFALLGIEETSLQYIFPE